MTKDHVVDELRNQEPTFLGKAKRKGWICPECGNGGGADGDGISVDPTDKARTHYKCFKCDLYADVIDLYGRAHGIADFKGKVAAAAEYYGIAQDARHRNQSQLKSGHTHTRIHIKETEEDHTAFFQEAFARIGETDYPQRRGLSEEVVKHFRLGFVPEWRHPKAPKAPPSPRLIIPTSRSSYVARDTRNALTDEQQKYRISKVGSSRIFNEEALRTAGKPVFIVEGEIDAMSIVEAGGEAVGLGSVANRRLLLDLLKDTRPAHPLIIAMDNDEAGARAAQEIEEGLKGLELPFYRLNPFGSHADANDALRADPDAFAKAIMRAEDGEDEATAAAREAYLLTAASYHLKGFIDGINASVNTPYIQTGFPRLDCVLDGGLYEGLYCFGAITSLGKTTFITQVADFIARSGQDVLVVSLEMARTEIMAKSISRHTIEIALAEGQPTRYAKTTRGITTGKFYEGYSQDERDLIDSAVRAYATYANHIYIYEGLGDIGAAQVRKLVHSHVAFTGVAPVVFIDYLQILAPHEPRATDKQNTDKSVMELKRISRDYKIPVVAVSSFNRQNYKEAVTMEAFKESGAVEYSSDVLMGMQLKGAGGKDFDSAEEKRKNPREVELVILKNRNGRAGDKIALEFHPLFNYFKEEL